jgi:hypothetical protein
MTKIDLIKKYLAEKKRLGEAAAAFTAVVAEPFTAPVDLSPADCAGLDDGEALAKYAYTGYATVEDLDDRRKLLARLIAANPHGRGRPSSDGEQAKVTISLPREMLRIVDEVAKASGVSRQKWIRKAVENFLRIDK